MEVPLHPRVAVDVELKPRLEPLDDAELMQAARNDADRIPLSELDVLVRHLAADQGRTRSRSLVNRKSYKNCFTGREAIQFMRQRAYAETPELAVAIGERMVAEGILVPAGAHSTFLPHKLFQVAALVEASAFEEGGGPTELDEHMQFEQRHLARVKAVEAALEGTEACLADTQTELQVHKDMIYATSDLQQALKKIEQDIAGIRADNYLYHTNAELSVNNRYHREWKPAAKSLKNRLAHVVMKKIDYAKYKVAKAQEELAESHHLNKQYKEGIKNLQQEGSDINLQKYISGFAGGVLMNILHNILRALFFVIVLGHFAIGVYQRLPLRARQIVVIICLTGILFLLFDKGD